MRHGGLRYRPNVAHEAPVSSRSPAPACPIVPRFHGVIAAERSPFLSQRKPNWRTSCTRSKLKLSSSTLHDGASARGAFASAVTVAEAGGLLNELRSRSQYESVQSPSTAGADGGRGFYGRRRNHTAATELDSNGVVRDALAPTAPKTAAAGSSRPRGPAGTAARHAARCAGARA